MSPPSPYLEIWLALGRVNPWIRNACDPPFNAERFYSCQDENELAEKLCEGSSEFLGAAFFLGDVCFIQQVDHGQQVDHSDEWLVIKQHVVLASFACRMMGRERFLDQLRSIQQAAVTSGKAWECQTTWESQTVDTAVRRQLACPVRRQLTWPVECNPAR